MVCLPSGPAHQSGWTGCLCLRKWQAMHRDCKGASGKVERRSIGGQLAAEEPRATSRTARPGMYDMLWLVQRRKQHTLVRCAMGQPRVLKYSGTVLPAAVRVGRLVTAAAGSSRKVPRSCLGLVPLNLCFCSNRLGELYSLVGEPASLSSCRACKAARVTACQPWLHGCHNCNAHCAEPRSMP